MSNYNADIRIGVVGQSKLSSLQKQLDRVNASVNKLNKALVLKTRAQTIKLNTKGANTAIKQLEDRINKLGRTITVNVRTNEKKGQGSSGNSTAIVTGGQSRSSQSAALATAVAASKALTIADKERLQVNKQLTPLLTTQSAKQKEIADQVAKINKNRTEAANVEKGFGTKARLNQLNFGYGQLNKKLQRLRGEYKGITSEVNKYKTAADGVNDDEIIRAEKRRQRLNDLRLKKKRGGQALRGGLAAGALSISNVPGLQGASQGALIGSVAGPAGAAAGAAVGALTDLAGAAANYANQAAVAAAETAKFELALRGVTSGSDYTTALEDIAQLSDQFTQDLGTTTEQFTKLTAATTANGISIDETAEVYRGLAAANLALGGNSERLQGILLATSQVFSKGKVQAEELRGQIGERLPGAFALFAKAVGKTPAELDKALERGEVTVEDFVKFTKQLFEQFGENAQVIRDAPENAGARLEKALGDLQRNVGKLLAPIGAAFQNIFTGIANVINDAAIALNKFLGIGTDNALAKVNKQLEETAGKLGTNGGRRDGFYNERIGELLKEQARLNDLKKGLAEPPTKPVSATSSGTGTTKGSGSAARGPADTTAQTRVELQLQQELLRIEQEKFALVGQEATLQDFDLQRQQLKAGLAASLQEIDQDNITAASKIAEKELERVKYATDLQAIKNAEKEFMIEQTKAFDEQVLELQNAIELEGAITDEMKRQVVLKQALAEIQGSDLSEDQKTQLAGLQERLNQIQSQNANPIKQYIDGLNESLSNTEGKIVQMAQTIQSELGSAISSSITGLIDGTTTVEEAFGTMFKNIGKAFIDMAAQMLAQKAVLMLLGAFTGGGSSVAPSLPVDPLQGWSGGGYTGDAPRTGGVDGQGGFPAILHPQETVIDHHGAMNTYSGGNSTAMTASSPVTAEVTYKGPTLNFNGNDYIPRSEASLLVAEGAKQGKSLAMKELQNSRSQRSRLGI